MGIARRTTAHLRLFTPAEMKDADEAADFAGIGNAELVRNAARAVCEEVLSEGRPLRRVAVLAGPGLNGEDGRVAAGLLRDRGLDVRVFGVEEFEDASFEAAGFDLVVDALFGAGLSRPLDRNLAEAVERLNRSGADVLAVDLPSGVDGLTGQVLGAAVQARRTVTFEARKPGHLLQPGRSLCGRITAKAIGLPEVILAERHGGLFANEPELWHARLLGPSDIGHKYDRGHAAVFSGPAHQTGAGRMAAGAALRGGAGLVTLLSPPSAVLVNAAHLTAVMLRRCADEDELAAILQDRRVDPFVLGPGFGVGQRARDFAFQVLEAGRRLVLDADGISACAEEPEELFRRARREEGEPALVLTPHEGEFARLFPDLEPGRGRTKFDRAREAARRSGAVVLLKGADTVIAEPGGRAAINTCASPWLATAGAGDALAGLVAAQLANGLPTFEATCAAAWVHGRAAQLFGPGLIAEDLPHLVPKVLGELHGGGGYSAA